MAEHSVPNGLNQGGRALWLSITEEHELDAGQLVTLEEACRAKDRCDMLHEAVNELGIHERGLATKVNETANLLKMLVAALRLPDEAGKRPQFRGARGAQKPTVVGGSTKISSLERARAAKQA